MMMLPWQSCPLNGAPRFARSIAAGSLTATAIVSHSELGWCYRIYRTDSGLFEEHLFHAGQEITPSRTRCMREATSWLKVAAGVSS